MEGMILAAGAGTRLGSITDNLPKALVQVGDKPLLSWVAESMGRAGVTRLIVNTHYHEERIQRFVRESGDPSIHFVFSPEPEGPYETGGGLFHAASLFKEETPFLLHNADVLSTIDLGDLYSEHTHAQEAQGDRMIASLAVQDRDSRRVLLFDDLGLFGWENRGSDRTPDGSIKIRDPVGEERRLAFTGIHVVDPTIFGLSDRTGAFSIITLYLELAAKGWNIHPIDVTDEEWYDVGTPQRLEEVRARFYAS